MRRKKEEGGANRERREIRGFRDVIDDCDLEELRFIG